MKSTRIFFYTGNIDEHYKTEAKKSLVDAGWIPVEGEVQVMECAGPSRQTCLLSRESRYFIVAQRDE
jgi:hypothetical protein